MFSDVRRDREYCQSDLVFRSERPWWCPSTSQGRIAERALLRRRETGWSTWDVLGEHWQPTRWKATGHGFERGCWSQNWPRWERLDLYESGLWHSKEGCCNRGRAQSESQKAQGTKTMGEHSRAAATQGPATPQSKRLRTCWRQHHAGRVPERRRGIHGEMKRRVSGARMARVNRRRGDSLIVAG